MSDDPIIEAMRTLDPNWDPKILDHVAFMELHMGRMLQEFQAGSARFELDLEKRRIEDHLATDERAKEALERPERFAGEHDVARAWLESRPYIWGTKKREE